MLHAIPDWALIAYLLSGVAFIYALRGLSSPASSRKGNRFGMAGMALAVVTRSRFRLRSRPAIICPSLRPMIW